MLSLSCQNNLHDIDGVEYLDGHFLKSFIQGAEKAVSTHDISFFNYKRGLKVSKIVDIEEFTESRDYMNQAGYIRPVIKYELDRLFTSTNYIEAVLTGAIGIGKNYFADLALAYMLYNLSCYHNPQLEYDLAPGSSIVFITQSMSLTLARKVVFDQFSARLKNSPYFMDHFNFDPGVKSELRFPHQIYVLPVGGNDTGAIGMNVFGGLIDELNFMARIQDSAHTRYTSQDEYDQAERLYSALIRRMKSRFMQKGKVPGKLLLISSVNYPGDFTDRKIEESETDKTIFVMKYSQWEALPKDRFCGQNFLVEVGNEFKQSRILTVIDEAVDEEDVIHVPTEYLSEFERDLDAALRDLAGVATGTKHPFIPFRENIKWAQDEHKAMNDGRSLFNVQSCVLSDIVLDPEDPDWSYLIDYTYIDECILDNAAVFATHIDVGLTNDAAGVGIGHISGYKMLPEFKYFNERTGEFVEVRDVRAPVYAIDGLLQVKAPPNGEVDLELVRDLILHLRGYINVRWGTLDSWQSAMMIQSFKKAKIRSGVLSVDASIAPYAEVKQAIKDKRIYFPEHDVGSKELREVEKDSKKEKIDHPEGGSKDCSDAIAGVVYMLHRKEASYGRSGRRRPGAMNKRSKTPNVRRVRIGRRRGRVV